MFINFQEHPELLRFLNANTEAGRREYAAFLKKSYPIYGLELEEGEAHCNTLELMLKLKKKIHFQTLLGLDFFSKKVAANDNFIFNQAVMNKDVELVKHLVQYKKVQDHLNDRDNFALKSAISSNCHEIIQLLLAFPNVFITAEKQEDNSPCIFSFIKEKLIYLHEKARLHKIASPEIDFDINDQEARLAFYMARSLIRRNKPNLLADLDFLLQIPAVKELAHLGMCDRWSSNELLFLALNRRNLDAALILLAIPKIKEVAMNCGQVSELLHLAISRNSKDILNQLLDIPDIFTFAVSSKEINELLGFTISINRKELFNDLLTIPEIRATAISSEQDNQLLLLALTQRDQHIIGSLLAIPELVAIALNSWQADPSRLSQIFTTGNQQMIDLALANPALRAIAIANNYYLPPDRRMNEVRLSEFAHKESSMVELSTEEHKFLNTAIKHYEPLINQHGLNYHFKNLQQTLKNRYEANPASISGIGKRKIKLPLEWKNFKKLMLTPGQYKQALKAYYSNDNHTAWRYFLKPNPWISKNAVFAVVNRDNRKERWSNFENFIPLIVLTWLGASDPTIKDTENLTLEARIFEYIKVLGDIQRAHNRDEGPDNLKKDDPGCPLGVTRRLYHSVIGHYLFQSLTMDLLKQELWNFVRDYFKPLIKNHSLALEKEYNAYLEDLKLSDKAILQELNIPTTEIENFMLELSEKYPEQFNDNPKFKKYLQMRFHLSKDSKGEATETHLLNFAGEIHLQQLIQENKDNELKREKPENNRFFAHKKGKQNGNDHKNHCCAMF